MYPTRTMRAAAMAVLCAGSLAGCARPPQQYAWGDYSHALYQNYSGDHNTNTLAVKLAAIIADGEPSGKVPPGIYAEYGYLMLSAGKSREACSYFEKEKALYSESAFFMDRMIAAANTEKPKESSGDQKGQNDVKAANGGSNGQSN